MVIASLKDEVAECHRGHYELEAAGITQPHSHAYPIRLKFGKQAYLVIELERGEDAARVAEKVREPAAQAEACSK